MITKPTLRKFWQEVILPIMQNGNYYTSQKIVWYMPFNLKSEFEYKVSSLMAELHKIKYLDRTHQNKVLHHNNRFNKHQCRWAYKINNNILSNINNSKQLQIL